MAYVTVAGLMVFLVLAILQGLGQLRRSLFQTRPPRHGDDMDWECSSEWRLPLRR